MSRHPGTECQTHTCCMIRIFSNFLIFFDSYIPIEARCPQLERGWRCIEGNEKVSFCPRCSSYACLWPRCDSAVVLSRQRTQRARQKSGGKRTWPAQAPAPARQDSSCPSATYLYWVLRRRVETRASPGAAPAHHLPSTDRHHARVCLSLVHGTAASAALLGDKRLALHRSATFFVRRRGRGR